MRLTPYTRHELDNMRPRALGFLARKYGDSDSQPHVSSKPPAHYTQEERLRWQEGWKMCDQDMRR